MKFSNCSKLPDVPNIRFCGLNGHLWSKLEVCLSIAYHVTIYKHFSSLRPLLVLGSHTSLSYLNAAVLFDYVFIHKYQNLIWFRSRLILLLPLFSSSCVFLVTGSARLRLRGDNNNTGHRRCNCQSLSPNKVASLVQRLHYLFRASLHSCCRNAAFLSFSSEGQKLARLK